MTTEVAPKANDILSRVKIEVDGNPTSTRVDFLVTGPDDRMLRDMQIYNELSRRCAAMGLQRPGLGENPTIYPLHSDGSAVEKYGEVGERLYQAKYRFNGRP